MILSGRRSGPAAPLIVGAIFWLGAPNLAVAGYVAQDIDRGYKEGRALVTADLNRDGRLDIVTMTRSQLHWFENPAWKKRVIFQAHASQNFRCLAVRDLDGDDRTDIVVGADSRQLPLRWFRQPGQLDQTWEVFEIASDSPIHQLDWGDVEANGSERLVVVTREAEVGGEPSEIGSRVVLYQAPRSVTSASWSTQVIEESIDPIDGLWVGNIDRDAADEILTASLEGVFLLSMRPDGTWNRRFVGEGNQEEGPAGAGVLAVGRFGSGGSYLASVEPRHGSGLVTYLPAQDSEALWTRGVVDARVGQGRVLWCDDLDSDEDDEILLGWQLPGGSPGSGGITLYDPQDKQWSRAGKKIIADRGIVPVDLAAGDLDNDGDHDIVAVGGPSQNIRIYWQDQSP